MQLLSNAFSSAASRPFALAFSRTSRAFLCRAETTTSLLVHLRTRSHAVDGHKEQFLRLDLPKEMIHVGEYGGEYLVLGHTEVRVLVVGVRAFACNVSQRAL